MSIGTMRLDNISGLGKLGLITPENLYQLNDRFVTDLSAGSVNATSAEPTGGARTVTDTNSKISIVGGVLDMATGGAANSGLWYSLQTRKAGLILLGKIKTTGVSNFSIAWSTAQTVATVESLRFTSSSVLQRVSDSTAVSIGTYTNSTDYNCALILRGTGTYFFIKGGTEFTNWTLLFSSTNRSNDMYPGVFHQSNTTVVWTADNLRIPTARWLPSPIASDSFNRADGALGSTDGAGHAESTGLGSGGAGLAWTSAVGTWEIVTNVATSSALSGGSGFATTTPSSLNTITDVVATRTAGVSGLVIRYKDSSNYIIAYHDGTNAKLDKVVAGSTTAIITAVATYSASAVMRVISSGTSFDLYYNNVKIGSTSTISDADLQTGATFGMYTTDTGATFNNFTIFPRGTSGEHNSLNQF